jgi:hypothetical protein
LRQSCRGLNQKKCDYSTELAVARALREQIDWEGLRRDVKDNDFAVAFLLLVDRLGITTT